MSTIVPAAPGFYALFLSLGDTPFPRQFYRHAIVAWRVDQVEIHGEDRNVVTPICIIENGEDCDFILNPDGSMVHDTGFVCHEAEVALSYALDQEAMGKRTEAKSTDVTATRQ